MEYSLLISGHSKPFGRRDRFCSAFQGFGYVQTGSRIPCITSLIDGSLGQVWGVASSSALFQSLLNKELRRRITGPDADEVLHILVRSEQARWLTALIAWLDHLSYPTLNSQRPSSATRSSTKRPRGICYQLTRGLSLCSCLYFHCFPYSPARKPATMALIF